jgi:hypothetical protein
MMNKLMRKINTDKDNIAFGSEWCIAENFDTGIQLANELINSMKITGYKDYDYHSSIEEFLVLTITKDNKTYQFNTNNYQSDMWGWDEPYAWIEDCINEVEPSLKALFRTYGGSPDYADEVTLTISNRGND